MIFLYPSLLWLLLPLMLLLWKSPSRIVLRMHLIILALLLLALARPVKENTLQETHIKSKDIIIALDVSYSMRATDLYPSRYTFAKETIKAFLAQNPKDNVMLIGFTTNPLLLSPPTTDHALINIALESLNPEYILTKGTSIKRLFAKLSTMHLGRKSLLLITDGGEEKAVHTLSTSLQKTDLTLTVLALGSKEGATIPDKNTGVLKDQQNNLVVSRINPMLKSLSQAVHGKYLTAAHSPEATAHDVSMHLQAQEADLQRVSKKQHQYQEWYGLPLVFALLLFLLVHTSGVKYLLIIFTLLGIPLDASLLDVYHLHHAYTSYAHKEYTETIHALKQVERPSLQSQWALANAFYKQGNYKKALQLYQSIHSTSIHYKQKLYYNIATTYAMLQAYDKAKLYYAKVLQLGDEADAAYNLSLIALLHDKKDAPLGIAHPKSQGANSSKSTAQEKKKKQTKQKNQSSSGAGGGGEKSTAKKEQKNKKSLIQDPQKSKHPLGSKVYDLINKGYIRETQPW